VSHRSARWWTSRSAPGLYVDHCDAFLMEQPSLILKRRKTVLPILLQRQQLADSLARTLSLLGLERIPLPISDRFARAQEELRKIGESKEDDDEPEKAMRLNSA